MGVVLVSESLHGRRSVVLLLAAFLTAAVVLPLIGPFALDLARVRTGQEPDWSIFVQLRVTRTLLGLFAGGALALAGALFQAMLRDALASPYTLGVSAGASLGAVVAIWLGWQQVAGVPAVWMTSLAGAGLVLVAVAGTALRDRRVSSFGLLLSGLAANSVCSALIIIIYSVVSSTTSLSITQWLIGSLDAVDYPTLVAFMSMTTVATVAVMRQARSWNLLAVDAAWAGTRGVSVHKLTLMGYGLGSILTACTVALVGPIGFVGLVVPHLVRTRVSADHRVLMPCAFLGGGVLLAACDTLGRLVLAPSEMPAGAMMALIGGPYLVWILRQRSVA